MEKSKDNNTNSSHNNHNIDHKKVKRQAALLRISAELAAAKDVDEICSRVVHDLC